MTTFNDVYDGYTHLPERSRLEFLRQAMIMGSEITNGDLIEMIKPLACAENHWCDLFELCVQLIQLEFGYSNEALGLELNGFARNVNLPEHVADLMVTAGCPDFWDGSLSHLSPMWTLSRIDTMIRSQFPGSVVCHWVVMNRHAISQEQFECFFARALETHADMADMVPRFPWAAEEAHLVQGGLWRKSDTGMDALFSMVAQDHHPVSPATLRRFYSLGWQRYGAMLVAHPGLPEEVFDYEHSVCVNGTPEWARLHDSEGRLRKLVANPSCPPRYLYYSLESRRLWQAMALNPRLPEDIRSLMLADGDEGVQEGMLHNESLPAEAWNAIASNLSLAYAETFLVNLANRQFNDCLLRDKRWSKASLMLAFVAVLNLEKSGHRSLVSSSQNWVARFAQAGQPLGDVVVEMVEAIALERWASNAYRDILRWSPNTSPATLWAMLENSTEADTGLASDLVTHPAANIKLLKAIAEKWLGHDLYIVQHATKRINELYKEATVHGTLTPGTDP